MNCEETVKTRLRSKGQITLPNEIREILNVEEGDDLIFCVNKDGQVVIQRGITIPADQAWFWTERWQRMEREAQADIEAGRVQRFANVDDAMTALELDENAGDRPH